MSKWIFLFLILFLAGGWNYGQQPVSRRICDTVAYELIHGKIVIPVTVNDVKVKYILDTGGQTATMREDAVRMQAKASGTGSNVSDLNQMVTHYPVGVLENVALSPSYKLSKLNTLVLPPSGFFKALGVAGILGGDAFAQSVITLDARRQMLVIDYPYRPSGLKLTDGLPLNQGNANHTFVQVNMGGITKEVLFDTGAEGFLLLSTADYAELKAAGKCETRYKAYGISGIGLAGLSEPSELAKVNLPELTFAGKTFTNIGCITTGMGKSMIGVEMLNYGKVVIDYMRDRFYFSPYEKGTADLEGAAPAWNVGILPVKDHFEVTTVWENIKNEVGYGDRVVNIDGTDLAEIPLSQLEVDRLMNTIPGDIAYIVLLKDGKEKRIEIKKNIK